MLEEKLKKLYMYLLKHNDISKSDILNFLSQEEVVKLLDDNILKENNGLYRAYDESLFYKYGCSLIKEKKYDDAYYYFSKCFEINKENDDVYRQMLLIALKKKTVGTFLTWIDKFLNSNDLNVQIDGKFYLYLYSNVAKIPRQYLEIVEKLDFIDIRIDFGNERYSDIPNYNKMRGAAFCKSFSNAIHTISGIIFENGKMSIDDILTKEMLRKVAYNFSKTKNELIEFIQNEDYESVINKLEECKATRKLNKGDKSILLIAKAIVSNTLIQRDTNSTSIDIFSAIIQQDYRLALKLNDAYLKHYNVSKEKSALNLILQNANSYIEQSTNNVLVQLNHKKEKFNEDNDGILSLKAMLLASDYTSFYQNLNLFLNKYGIVKYEKLIVSYVQICILKKENNYSDVFNLINELINGTYNYDVSLYLDLFYNALDQCKLRVAYQYLNILKFGKELGYDVDVLDLDTIFENNMNNGNNGETYTFQRKKKY